MGITITKNPTINVEPERAVLADVSVVAKVVHTILDCSFLLAGKSRSGHGYKSRSKQEHKALFLIALVSINTAGGFKITDQVAKVHERFQST